MNTIDTDQYSSKLREKGIDIQNRSILITNFSGTDQEKDLTEPANCNGFGRVRHFKFKHSSDWPSNPLPILPAAKALGMHFHEEIRAQVFQNSICNWRCWYCFVDFKLLNGDKRHASLLTCDDLIDLFLQEKNVPLMIDLSGGQPDLTPEWVPWMMEALKSRGLSDKIYLWSDDNLSNDYFWQYLSDEQIELISSYKMYGRVCCFKGVDENSFSLNTKASPDLFKRQFELFERLYQTKIDLYSYITLTAPPSTDFKSTIPAFFDRVQKISEYFPMRIVPLKIYEFTPVIARMNDLHKELILGQHKALEIWMKILEERIPNEIRSLQITEVPLKN